MDHPSASGASGRPRRSRAGLVVFLVVLGLASWEIVGRASDVLPVTPVKFAQACWAVATGHGGGGIGAPSLEEQQKNAFRPLPYVMYGFKPNWTRQPPPNQPDLKRTSNSLGFRGPEPQMPKPAGRYRIVCLGGSTTYSDTVSDDDAYPRLLEKVLRAARPGRDIEVINCGVNSYTSAETLNNLAFHCLDLQPDAIVLYEGINDYRTRVYRNFASDYSHYRKVWDGTVAHWETGPGEMKGGINPFIQLNLPPDNGKAQDNVRNSGTGAFRRNLTSIAGIAKAHGVAVVMVSNVCDEHGQYTEPDFITGLAEHNQVVREVAAQQGALFIDMAAKFQQPGQFVDPVHMNPTGSLQMARLIADGLLAGLL